MDFSFCFHKVDLVTCELHVGSDDCLELRKRFGTDLPGSGLAGGRYRLPLDKQMTGYSKVLDLSLSSSYARYLQSSSRYVSIEKFPSDSVEERSWNLTSGDFEV